MQSVETPNGLIANMYGPVEGRRHDAFMLGMRSLTNPVGGPYVIYGDHPYGLS